MDLTGVAYGEPKDMVTLLNDRIKQLEDIFLPPLAKRML
jgi:hypothetical protein